MKTLTVTRGRFDGVAYTPDGRFLVTVNSGRQIRIWDLGTYNERFSFWVPEGAPDFRFQQTTTLYHGLLALMNCAWDLSAVLDALAKEAQPAKKTKRPRFSGAEPTAITLEDDWQDVRLTASPDGKAIAGAVFWYSQGHQAELRLWDRGGKLQQKHPVSGDVFTAFSHLALAPGGRTLAATPSVDWSADASTRLHDLISGEELARLPTTGRAQRVLFSPEGRRLAIAAERSVWLWDVAERKLLKKFPSFRKHCEALAFSADGRLVGAGSGESEVRVWDVDSFQEVARYNWDIGAIHGLAFAPDGLTMAAAGHDRVVAIWDLV